jgi:hypothetical protein
MPVPVQPGRCSYITYPSKRECHKICICEMYKFHIIASFYVTLQNVPVHKTKMLQDVYFTKSLSYKMSTDTKAYLYETSNVHTRGKLRNIKHHQPMDCTFLRSQGPAHTHRGCRDHSLCSAPARPSAGRLSCQDRMDHWAPK